MSQLKKVRRSRFLVDPEVQNAFLRRCALQWGVFLLATFLLTFMIQYYSAPHNDRFLNHIEAFWNQHGLICIVLISLMPVFVMDLTKMTNRFAGPVVRLRAAIRAVSNGQAVTPIRFRKGDFWQELSSEFNLLLAMLPEARGTAENTHVRRHTDHQGLDEASLTNCRRAPADLVATRPS